MAFDGVQVAQSLLTAMTAALLLLTAFGIGVALWAHSTASNGGRRSRFGLMLELFPARVPVARDATAARAVRLRAALASRAPPGFWDDDERRDAAAEAVLRRFEERASE